MNPNRRLGPFGRGREALRKLEIIGLLIVGAY
jgi:hypothetical protein